MIYSNTLNPKLTSTPLQEFYQDDSDNNSVPIYTYDPSTGGTQV